MNGQRPDGGWGPFWAPDYSAIDATCFHLAQAVQLGLNSGPAVQSAVSFLADRQRPDGSWEEIARAATGIPPWARPGDEVARLYLTANAGLWSAVLNAGSGVADEAAHYLAQYVRPNGQLPSFLHTQWLAGSLFWCLGARSQANTILGYLRKRLPDLVARNLGWLGQSLLAAGVPVDHPLLKAAAAGLEQEQEPDGRWVSEDGPQSDVHTTLEALGVLYRVGAGQVNGEEDRTQ